MPVIDLGPVVGPQGPQGATGATGAQGIQGQPGPNQVNSATSTPLNGVLAGNGTSVTVKPVDSVPTANSTNLVSSGGVQSSRVPINGMGKNLLYNWYFVGGGSGYGAFPINQRGQNSYSTNNAYTIDGWRVENSTLLVQSNYIRMELTSGQTSCEIRQLVDGLSKLNGKRVTASVWLASAGVLSGSVVVNTTSQYQPVLSDTANNVNILLDHLHGGYIYFRRTNSTEATNIVAVKLELGDQQTLAHNEGTDANPVWVLNEYPDYTAELLKCQQHLYAVPRYHSLRATAVRTNAIYFSFPLPTPLIGTAALEDSSGLSVQSLSGTSQTGFTFSVGQNNGSYFQITATKTSHGLTDAVLSTGASGPLLIAAE